MKQVAYDVYHSILTHNYNFSSHQQYISSEGIQIFYSPVFGRRKDICTVTHVLKYCYEYVINNKESLSTIDENIFNLALIYVFIYLNNLHEMREDLNTLFKVSHAINNSPELYDELVEELNSPELYDELDDEFNSYNIKRVAHDVYNSILMHNYDFISDQQFLRSAGIQIFYSPVFKRSEDSCSITHILTDCHEHVIHSKKSISNIDKNILMLALIHVFIYLNDLHHIRENLKSLRKILCAINNSPELYDELVVELWHFKSMTRSSLFQVFDSINRNLFQAFIHSQESYDELVDQLWHFKSLTNNSLQLVHPLPDESQLVQELVVVNRHPSSRRLDYLSENISMKLVKASIIFISIILKKLVA